MSESSARKQQARAEIRYREESILLKQGPYQSSCCFLPTLDQSKTVEVARNFWLLYKHVSFSKPARALGFLSLVVVEKSLEMSVKPASCIGVSSAVGVGDLGSVISLPLSSSLPFSILFFFFWSGTGSHHVANLQLTEICLPLPPAS